MAVVMHLRCQGLDPATYDRVVSQLDLDASPPIGQVVHLAFEEDGEIRACDVWQTAAAALHYVESRLEPVLRREGAGTPEVEIVPLHNLFAPDIDMIERIGGVALPAHVTAASRY